MSKVDPKIQTEILKKIDGLAANFSNPDFKKGLKNFLNLFVEKIKEDKSITHVDTLSESLRQYTITLDIERRFTALIILLNFLLELSKNPKANFYSFLDKIEFDIIPEIVSAYLSYNQEVTRELDMENVKYKYNLCVLTMILIEKILTLCCVNFSFNKNKEIRTFERYNEQLIASPKVQAIMNQYKDISLDIFLSDINYLEIGSRESMSRLSNSNVIKKQDFDTLKRTSINNNNSKLDTTTEIISSLQKIRDIREKMMSFLKSNPSNSDLNSFDEQLEIYKNECIDFSTRVKSIKNDSYSLYKNEVAKESSFLQFLLEDMPKIFEKNANDINLTLVEIKKRHEDIFGQNQGTQPSAILYTQTSENVFTENAFGDFQQNQSQREFGFNDFDKMRESSRFSNRNLGQEGDNLNEYQKDVLLSSRQFENFQENDAWKPTDAFENQRSSNRQSVVSKTSQKNEFTEFQNKQSGFDAVNFDDFPDVEDKKRIDGFIKKSTNKNSEKMPVANSNSNNLFGVKNDFFDRPSQQRDSQQRDSQYTIHNFEDFENKNSFENVRPNPFLENQKINPGADIRSKVSIISETKPKRKSNFNDMFGEFEEGIHSSNVIKGKSITGSMIQSRHPGTSSLLSSNQGRQSNNQGKKSLAQLNFNNNRSPNQESKSGIRESLHSDNLDTVHQALQRMSLVTSNQHIIKSRISNRNVSPQMIPPTVKINPTSYQNNNSSSIAEINFQVNPSQITFGANKNPAPFTAVYEDTRQNANSQQIDYRFSRQKNQQMNSSNIKKSNITINPIPPQQELENAPFERKDTLSKANEVGFNLDDFGSVKSNANNLVESILETLSIGPPNKNSGQNYTDPLNNQQQQFSIPQKVDQRNNPQFQNQQQSIQTPNKNQPQNQQIENQNKNKKTLNLEFPQKYSLSDNISLVNEQTNKMPQNQIDKFSTDHAKFDKKSSNSQNEDQNKNKHASDPSVKITYPEANQVKNDIIFAQNELKLTEYKNAISQYETMLKSYKQEITELKQSNSQLTEDKQNYKETISMLKTENINLNEFITSLKIKLETEQNKHENQLMKQKEQFKKNNEGKIVAMERSYNENLQKIKVELNANIMQLQEEINTLTMDKNTLVIEKEHLSGERSNELSELKELVTYLRKQASEIKLELENKKNTVNSILQDNRLKRKTISQAQGNVYNQLLLERKKNTELSKQLFSFSNEINIKSPNVVHHEIGDFGGQFNPNFDPQSLKKTVLQLRSSHQNLSLGVMSLLSGFNLTLTNLVKNKSSKISTKIQDLKNMIKLKNIEMEKIQFESEDAMNQLSSTRHNLKQTLEELQAVKKEIIDSRILNQNANFKGELDVDLLRKQKKMELENKQLLEYNRKIQDELLLVQEKVLIKESEFVPIQSHFSQLKKIEIERDELLRFNKMYLNELKLRSKVSDKYLERPSKRPKESRRQHQEVDDEYELHPNDLQTNNDKKNKSFHNIIVANSMSEIVSGQGRGPEMNGFSKGSALLQKTKNLITNIDKFTHNPTDRDSIIDSLVSQGRNDLRSVAQNCSQRKYNLIRNSSIAISVEERIYFFKSLPKIDIILKFRSFSDLQVNFSEISIECKSKFVKIESDYDQSQVLLHQNESKSILFVLNIEGNYFLDLKPLFLLFKVECVSDIEKFSKFVYSQTNLDDFQRVTLPLTVNKMLETQKESLEKFSIIKTLNNLAEVNVRVGGSVNLETIANVFPNVITLSEEECIFGLKVLSPQGIFFLVFVGKEKGTLNIKIFGMFELKVYDSILEVLDFIFKNSFY